jgi:ribosomal protein L29
VDFIGIGDDGDGDGDGRVATVVWRCDDAVGRPVGRSVGRVHGISLAHWLAPRSHARRTEFASPEAIQGEVDRLRKEMFTMRIKFAKREEYQPAQYRALKKRVAQLLTIQRERTVDAGVSLREARAAEKRMMVEAGLRQF